MKLSIRISCIAAVAMLAVPGGYANAQPAATPASSATGTSLAASDASDARAARTANRKLAHRVENALARTRGLNSARIIVTARDGRVTLSGAVNYNEQIPLALDAARKVDGVTDVESRIRATGASL
ncbi:BON domain-containing protein [Paraburkholderia sp. MPAMCS5]|uniref:BON domain-containing protein n=1 Tax=Paraburkholderia sp. MPAMCS5 TaxID=3112563 RepID=UPI002E17F9D7|nr:BON domain-containing protein [Paraburkholderia sp. MPAMCS5]